MPDDLDHEVIDSPQALFRHLHEAHGVAEALDLDPATAPLQFWLRKHAELERAATRATVQDRMAAPAAARASGGPGPASPGEVTGSGPRPRFRPFADPVVEAVAAALVGRGLDERRVRRGLSTFSGTDGRHGEEAVRAAFIAPMLQAVAAHLAGDPPNRVQSPPPAAPREVAGHETRPAARATGPEPEPDFMAIADVLQQRRRSRQGGRRDPTAPPATSPPATATPATRPPAATREPDDDVMALADALQRRRGSGFTRS